MPVLSGLPVAVDRRSCGPDFGFGKESGSFDGVLETGDSFGYPDSFATFVASSTFGTVGGFGSFVFGVFGTFGSRVGFTNVGTFGGFGSFGIVVEIRGGTLGTGLNFVAMAMAMRSPPMP